MEFVRDCSDCNQHRFGQVCVRFILKKFYLLLTTHKRLSRWFYRTLIEITKILYSVLPNTKYCTVVLQPIFQLYKPIEIHFVLLLLQNMIKKGGLCNGTKLIFKKVFSNKLLLYRFPSLDKTVLITSIKFITDPKFYSFEWSRRQFHIRVVFSTTINRA